MRCKMANEIATKYGSVDVLTELDLIHDQVTVGDCEKLHLIKMLDQLIKKLKNDGRSYRIWTFEETEYLMRNYKNQGNLEIGKILGRPISSVNLKAHSYGLKKSKEYLAEMNVKNRRGDLYVPRAKKIEKKSDYVVKIHRIK